MTFILAPKKLTLVLALVVLGLTLAHVATQVGKYLFNHHYQFGLVHLFDLNEENNIPSWYASSALLLCAGLLAVIGLGKRQVGDRHALQWFGLAIIFLYLSVDEAASLHEMTMPMLRSALEPLEPSYFYGYLYYSWVILGSIFVLIVALAYLRFLLALPVKTRSLFLIAGTLYVGGALGVEFLGANHAYLYGEKDLTYSMLVVWEEGFEMLGVIVFIYALSSYMGLYESEMRVLFRDDTGDAVN